MSAHIYKIVELAGSSKTGIDDAVKNAVEGAQSYLSNARWFEVSQIRGQIENGKVAYWQVVLKLGYNSEEERNPVSGSGKAVSAQHAGPKTGSEKNVMSKYRCKVCGYIYDPEKGDPDNGIKPGTAFKDLPSDWTCPECGVNKEQFEMI